MEQNNKEIIKEVLDEIEASIKDPRGLVAHQRRLAFLLSLGIIALIENYLSKFDILKPRAKINHPWYKKQRDNVKDLISNQITCPVNNIKNIEEILDIAFDIEKERNKLAYGKLVSENVLKEKINLFFTLKKKIEK